jgi:galactokinase
MVSQALEAWAARFDGRPTVVSVAPGRVNLIGEHTDYNEGYVLPAALEMAVAIAARPATEERLASAQVPDAADHRGPGWRRYASACRSALAEIGVEAPPLEAVVYSTVPGGSGLSSSAALLVAFVGAWNELLRLALEPEQVAQVAWRAENEFVGVKVGRMDQMASAMGVDGAALFIDMRTLEVEPCRLPGGMEIGVLDTRKPRSVAAGKYNERVAECARAVEAISKVRPIDALRDATLEDLRSVDIDEVARRRARHVITENRRVLEFRDALKSGDKSALGTLCEESHRSLKEDYEVSVAELDAMARSARAAPGCIAARMTGAGFGGCCVALIESGSFDEFKRSTLSSYGMYGFPTPHVFRSKASRGAYAISY